jgi:hypothetical protein
VQDNKPAALSRRLTNVGLIFVAIVLFIWQLGHPVLRFTRPIFNDILGWTLAFSLPWFAGAAIYCLGRWWSKALAVVLVIPLLVYSLLVFFGLAVAGPVYKDGHDLSFDRFAETGWKGSLVRLYRTNGGATTDYGVVLRHERVIVPGILVVRSLDAFDHCYSVTLKHSDQGIQIQDGRGECRAISDRQRNYRLKPFVYF